MAYTRSKSQAGRGTIFAIGPISGQTPPTGLTGATASSSATITAMSATVGIVAGMTVSGAGVPAGATVVSIVPATSITISAACTASATAVALTFTNTFITVGELKSGDPGKGQFDKEDVSNFQSALDKEYSKLMRDNGAPKLTGNRVGNDAGQVAVEAAYDDGNNPYTIQVTLPINTKAGQSATGDVYTFDALMIGRSFGPVETNKVIPFDVELQITGPVTFTAGS